METASMLEEEIEKNKRGSDTMTDANESEVRAKTKTILLIEDEEKHAELIRRIFEKNGFEWDICHVTSLKAALRWLEENNPPSLVIADYVLPDGTGLDIAKGATCPEEVGFPLIILTAFGSEQLAVRSFKSGAIDYVAKNAEEVQGLPWTAERAIHEWENIIMRKRAEEERERLLKELEAKNAELENFSHTVSHDLRAPLFAIQGFASILSEDLEQGKVEKVESDLKQIENGVTKMDRLLTDTLELSRIGRVANPPEDVPFGEIVQEALEQIAAKIKQSGIEVSVADDATVHVDRMRIVKVLVNLIENSVNYMGEQPHPKIDIGHRVDGEETVFFVRDNGMGIEKSQHEKVFELFYKADRSGKGTGAGLAIVKRIIEVHGGRIWIESEKGKGCTVCLTLPFHGNNKFK